MPQSPRIPVSWGELVDKITILEIKTARLSNPEALANVAKELALLREVGEAGLAQNAELAALKERLRAVNETLWDIEDRIRGKEAQRAFDDGFVALARSVYLRNDERAALKRQVNSLLPSDLVEEKSYTAY